MTAIPYSVLQSIPPELKKLDGIVPRHEVPRVLVALGEGGLRKAARVLLGIGTDMVSSDPDSINGKQLSEWALSYVLGHPAAG